jgi:hypothetical protein
VAKRYCEDWVRKQTSERYIVSALGIPIIQSQYVVRKLSLTELTGWYQWVRFVCVYWQLGLRINDVLAQPVPTFHQSIQIVSAWMHLHPSRMIFGRRRFCVSYCLQSSFVINLLMAPYPVCPHVCAVQVVFAGVKHHAVYGGLVTVLKVLNVLGEVAGRVDRKDIAEACIVVERIAVHGVGWLLCREKEDGAGLGVGVIGFGC